MQTQIFKGKEIIVLMHFFHAWHQTCFPYSDLSWSKLRMTKKRKKKQQKKPGKMCFFWEFSFFQNSKMYVSVMHLAVVPKDVKVCAERIETCTCVCRCSVYFICFFTKNGIWHAGDVSLICPLIIIRPSLSLATCFNIYTVCLHVSLLI